MPAGGAAEPAEQLRVNDAEPAQASMVTAGSGTIGMCSVTRSPVFRPTEIRSPAADSFT